MFIVDISDRKDRSEHTRGPIVGCHYENFSYIQNDSEIGWTSNKL